MKVAVFSSDVDELISSNQIELFRLSPNLEYLALAIKGKLTLFMFKLNLNRTIELEVAPVQIEFLGNVIAVKHANRRIRFYQIKVAEKERNQALIELIQFGPAQLEGELMAADSFDRKCVVLTKEELWVFTIGKDDNTLLAGNYSISNCRPVPTGQLAISRASLFSPQSIFWLNADELHKLDIPTANGEVVKPVRIRTQLSNIVHMSSCQNGYVLLVNSDLSVELVFSNQKSAESQMLRKLVNSNKQFPSSSIQLLSAAGRDMLVVYVEATNSLYQFELAPFGSAQDDFVRSIQRIKVKEKILKFEVSEEAAKLVIILWNGKGLKNLKIKQQDAVQEVEVPKVKSKEKEQQEVSKPRRILQRESKALKPASEPPVASSSVVVQPKPTEQPPELPKQKQKETEPMAPVLVTDQPKKAEQAVTVAPPEDQQPSPPVRQNPFMAALVKDTKAEPLQAQEEKRSWNPPKPEEAPNRNDQKPMSRPTRLPASAVFASLFDSHLESYEKRMGQLVDQQASKLKQALAKTSSALAITIPANITTTLRPQLRSFLEKDFTDRIELYFQEIFKRIGQTHQQGVNYVSEMHRLAKEKIDRIDQEVVLHNLARLEAVLAEIKTHLNENPSESLKKVFAEVASRLEAVGAVLEESLRRQTELASEEGKHCQQLLDQLEVVRKAIGQEAPQEEKRKKYLLIRRND